MIIDLANTEVTAYITPVNDTGTLYIPSKIDLVNKKIEVMVFAENDEVIRSWVGLDILDGLKDISDKFKGLSVTDINPKNKSLIPAFFNSIADEEF